MKAPAAFSRENRAFCVLVECVLNAGGLLVWEYPFWNRTFAGIWLILVFGYFEFFAAINLVLMNVVGMGVLGWRY